MTSETNAATDCLFAFTGRMFDETTGLQNNLNRWYDATTGRWLSEDPVGYGGSQWNLYQYCGNLVVCYVDPWGLERVSPGACIDTFPARIDSSLEHINPDSVRGHFKTVWRHRAPGSETQQRPSAWASGLAISALRTNTRRNATVYPNDPSARGITTGAGVIVDAGAIGLGAGSIQTTISYSSWNPLDWRAGILVSGGVGVISNAEAQIGLAVTISNAAAPEQLSGTSATIGLHGNGAVVGAGADVSNLEVDDNGQLVNAGGGPIAVTASGTVGPSIVPIDASATYSRTEGISIPLWRLFVPFPFF